MEAPNDSIYDPPICIGVILCRMAIYCVIYVLYFSRPSAFSFWEAEDMRDSG